jgi:hypothetical protein
MSKMSYKMFIDDERAPPGDGIWVIVRNFADFKLAIDNWGFPYRISFDHDLGSNEPTGYDIAHWMVDTDLNLSGAFIPADFTFTVHSQNPVGAANIQGLLDNYLSHRTLTDKIILATN